MEIVETRQGWFEPLFSVNDICELLSMAPSTVRYWIQRRWLESHAYEKGYLVSWMQLQTFLDKHGGKLRKVKSLKLEDVVAKELHPEQLTKNILFKRLKEKMLRDYKLWVFEACQRQHKLGLPIKKLLKADDKAIAKDFDIPLPEGYDEVKAAAPEELENVKREELQRFLRIMTRTVVYAEI